MADQRNTEEPLIGDRVVSWTVSCISSGQGAAWWLSRAQRKLQPLDGFRGQSSFGKLGLLRAGLASASWGLPVIVTFSSYISS